MRKFFFLLLLIFPCLVQSQTLTAFRGEVTDGYDFWISTPLDYDSLHADRVPVILFLHGASLCGNNLERVRRYGPLDALAKGRHIEAIIIAPQNPGGAWNPERVNNVVDWAFAHFGGDTNRFYVLGMSLGGYGTIDYCAEYSNRVAAAIAMCGGGNPKSYCGLNDMPLWILHGTADRDVRISQSQKVINEMAKCGDSPRLRFTKLAGVNHGGLARAFYITETYAWLFHHRLDTPDRPVNQDYEITPAMLKNAYRDIDRNANQLRVVDNGVKVATAKAAPSAEVVKQEGTENEDTAVDQTQAKAEESAVKYHTIRQGDTLGALARKYHTSVKKLCSLNNITETTILSLGRKLRVR